MSVITCKAIEYPSEKVVDIADLTRTGRQMVRYDAKLLIEAINQLDCAEDCAHDSDE